MNKMVLIAVELLAMNIAAANPGDGVGCESGVSDSTMGVNKSKITLALALASASVVGVVVVVLMWYYRRGGAGSTAPA
jgi:hypothetical protein